MIDIPVFKPAAQARNPDRETRTAEILGARWAPMAVICIVLFSFGLLAITDPDYWWHLRTGQQIVQNHAVPKTDPFSFTVPGKAWVAHEWLAEVWIYGLQSAGGYALNVVFFVSAAIGALLITYGTSLRLGASRPVAMLLFIWAAAMSQPYWLVRPVVFSWVLFAAFLYLIVEHRHGDNRLWLMPPLMVVWANLHLGFVYGLAAIGLYTAAVIAEKMIWHEARDLKGPLLALIGCVGATLLTPNPLKELTYPLTYLRPGGVGVAVISEWASPNFHAIGSLPLAAAILALVGVGVFDHSSTSGRMRGHDLFLPCLALVFTFLALEAVRNQPLFAIVFFVVVAAVASERWGWARPSAGPPAPTRARFNQMLVVAAIVAATVFLSQAPGLQLHKAATTDGAYSYPKDGAEFIRANYPDARLFNNYQWGGYLIERLYPQKVFVDGRSDMYGDDLLASYLRVSGVQRGWENVLDKYGVDVVIISKGSLLGQRLEALPGNWRAVFTGPIEVVYTRNAE